MRQSHSTSGGGAHPSAEIDDGVISRHEFMQSARDSTFAAPSPQYGLVAAPSPPASQSPPRTGIRELFAGRPAQFFHYSGEVRCRLRDEIAERTTMSTPRRL